MQHTDGAGDEEFDAILLGDLDDVVEAFDVDAHGKWNVHLANGREQRAEVDDPVDSPVHHKLL